MLSKILSRIIFILLLLTTLTPLVYQKKLFYSYDSEKGLFFRFIIEIIFGLWLILILKEPSFRPRRTPINLSLMVLSIVLIIVDIFGVDAYVSIFSNFERMAGLILYLCIFGYCLVVASVVNCPKKWLTFGIALAFVAFIVSVKGIIQSYNMEEMTLNSGRVVATVGNANQLASYLILGFFVVGLLITEWILPLRKDKKMLANLYLSVALIFLIFYSICLLKTSTRGALAGLMVGGGLMLVLTFLKTSLRKTKLVVGTVLMLIFILIAGLFYFRKASFIQQNSALNRITRISDNNGTNTLVSRLENYKVALEGIKSKPWFGWGQETYHYTYAQFFNPKLYADATWYDRVHNIILEWLIIGGIAGLLAYLSLWGAILYQLWRRKSRLNMTIKIILSGFLLTYFVSNLSLFDNLLSLMAFMTVISFIEYYSVEKEGKQFYIFTNNFILSGSIFMVILMFFIIKLTCINAYQTNKLITKAYNAESLEEVIEIYAQAYPKALIGRQEIAEQLASMAKEIGSSPVPENTKKLYFETTQNILQKELNFHPDYVRLQIIFADVFEAQNNYTEAIKIHEKVQISAPKYQRNLTDLGILYAKNNQSQKGLEILKKTLLMEPSNDEAKVKKAIIYAMQNDTLKRNEILNNLSEDALNQYINQVKYAYSLTNNLDTFISQIQYTSFKTTENLYHEWAITANSIKNYPEAARAVNLYRLHYWDCNFVDNRHINVLRKDILKGRNPDFAFEKVTE